MVHCINLITNVYSASTSLRKIICKVLSPFIPQYSNNIEKKGAEQSCIHIKLNCYNISNYCKHDDMCNEEIPG